MIFLKKGCGLLAATASLALAGPAFAQWSGNVQARIMFNDFDKISRDNVVGDNAINKKKTELFGYFTEADHPGWFGGFYAARELNYRQGLERVGPNEFRNTELDNANTVTEVYFGKTHFGDFGEASVELMVGGESQRDGFKYRPKMSGRYEFANGVSVFGYGMVLVQDYSGPSQSVAVDREFQEAELQPGLGYKINDHLGVWVNYRLRDRTQKRAMFGDLKERERFVELGLWKNFGDIYTSLRFRSGSFEMWDTLENQVSTRNNTIRKDKGNRLLGEFSMPLANNVRGIVSAGYLWEKYGIARDGAVTHLRAPIVFLALRRDL